jgi:formylglycine-generating enzyme required for sulfatase activity
VPLTQGLILNNRYRIVRLLGQGGFGAVYKGWDTTLNTSCAVKESFELSTEGQRQFLREAQILAGLRHLNLPRVTDFFTLPGQGQYLVMDFIEGKDLEELRSAAGGRLPESQVIPWITQACDALGYLHEQNPPIIHRDIKPANFKITPPDKNYPQGRVMLVDFGVAKVFDPSMRTTIGARAVTPGFSPHEQYGMGITDARSDIYALGATMYMLLTGQEPEESIQRVVRDPLIPPRQLNPDISPATEYVVLKALQTDPDKRFLSAAEFKHMIRYKGVVSNGQIAATQMLSQEPFPLSIPAPSPFHPPTFGLPNLISSRPFPWKWFTLGAGLLAGLSLLVGLTGLAVWGFSTRVKAQTTQAHATQTPHAIAVAPTYTPTPTTTCTPSPSPLPPTFTSTSTPSPLPPTVTSTPLPPSPTPTLSGPPMVLIPAGTFQMGSNSGHDDEQPVHSVTLDSYYMDVYEVTNAMYAQCVSDGACSPPFGAGSSIRESYYEVSSYDNYPVITVDWNQAMAYCNWAGKRLPTEAEWEYAARGGLRGGPYPWGEGIDCDWANYWPGASCVFVGDTSEVGSYPPNGYGLYDMAGNVWEWVADWYNESYYRTSLVENPSGPANGTYRVLRGGSWGANGNYLRVASRSYYNPTTQYLDVGFRCAHSP